MYFTAYTPIFPYEFMMQMIPNFLPRGHGMYVIVRSETKEETECDLCAITEEKNAIFPPVRLFGKRSNSELPQRNR